MADVGTGAGRRIYPNRMRFFVRNYLVASLACAFVFAAGFVFGLGGMQGMEYAALATWAVSGGLIAAMFAYTALYCDSTHMRIESEEVVYESGVFDHKIDRIPIHMITDVKTERTLLDKALGTSKIFINTSGGPAFEVAAQFGQKDVEQISSEITGLIEQTPGSVGGQKVRK